MLVTGTGAEDSIEMITTNTSGRDEGQSRAKVNRTLRLCLSNTVTGNKLPERDLQRNKKNKRECDVEKMTPQGIPAESGVTAYAYWV